MRAVLCGGLLAGALLGCSASDGDAAAGDAGASSLCSSFSAPGIAYAATFTNFHSWPHAPAVGPDGATDGLHGIGPLEVYWNAAPPHGATSFPQCTIVVKESEEADVTQRTVFAMVKRGDGYNPPPNAAVGWEWFSLENNTDGTVDVLWGQPTPPPGETYAGQTVGDCNGCHSLAAQNDFVWDTALQLSNF